MDDVELKILREILLTPNPPDGSLRLALSNALDYIDELKFETGLLHHAASVHAGEHRKLRKKVSELEAKLCHQCDDIPELEDEDVVELIEDDELGGSFKIRDESDFNNLFINCFTETGGQ